MKKKIVAILPFIIMPIFAQIYVRLENLILVNKYGCGCVLCAPPNILGFPFNVNDLRMVVLSLLAIGLSVWSIFLSKRYHKITRILYCLAVIAINVVIALLVI